MVKVLICMLMVMGISTNAKAEDSVMFDVVKGKNQKIWDFLPQQVDSWEWGGGDISAWQSANVNIRCFVPTETTDLNRDQMSCEISPVVDTTDR